MARNGGTAVLDPEAMNEDGTPVVEKAKQKSKPGIFCALPEDLIKAVSDRGEAENKPNGRVVAECVAQLFGYELPTMDRVRRGSGASGEPGLKGIGQKAKNAAILKLIELADQGLIELTPDLKVLLGRA